MQKYLAAMLGPAVYSAALALVLRIIAREGAADDVADFLLAQAVATPAALFVGMRQREQLGAQPYAGSIAGRIRRLSFVSLPVVVLGVGGWVVFASGQRSQVGVAVFVANMAQAFLWSIQGWLEQAKRFLTASLIDLTLGIAALLSVLFGYRWAGLATGAVLLAASWAAIAVSWLAAAIRQSREAGVSPTLHPLRDDLVFGASAMTQVGQISTSRIGTDALVGPIALAQLGTASLLVRLGMPFVQGGTKLLAPVLGSAARDGVMKAVVLMVLRRTVIAATTFSLAAAFAGFFFGPGLLGFVFDESVAPGRLTAAIVIGSAGLLYSSMYLGQVLVALKQSDPLGHAAVAGMVVTAVLLVPLALVAGVEGSAIALAAGYLARLVVTARATFAATWALN